MHIRITTSRQGKKTYHYPQLVESYRRKEDGKPTHRVVANLGKLSPQTIDNLRIALRAGRHAQAVVLDDQTAACLRGVRVSNTYSFLPVLVALQAWQKLGLDLLLRSVLPAGRAQVDVQAVLAALTFHRAIAPASKLAASRWYARTALPELQGIDPKRFNNTRVHGALSALDKAEEALQTGLPEHLGDRVGPYQAMFLDLSDTWFEGRGSPLAEETRTKEGLLRHRIGIALLCDQRGFPLRWKTLPGKFGEATVMGDIVEEIKSLPWVGENPIAMDRAMGNATTLVRLLGTEVRFVTAIPGHEFDSWTEAIPWQPFAGLDLLGTKKAREEDLRAVYALASATPLEEEIHRTRRWILDLGTVVREDLHRDPPPGQGPVANMLRQALAFETETRRGDSTQEQIADRHSTTKRTVRRYLILTRLVPEVRERVLAGEAERLAHGCLKDLAKMPPEKQVDAFEQRLVRAPARKQGRRLQVGGHDDDAPPVAVRLVVTFNPEAFVNQRLAAREDLKALKGFLADLNRRLRSKSSRRKPGSIEREVGNQLHRLKLAKVFTLHIDDHGGCSQVRLECDKEALALRHRYHGFNVIAAHPELDLDAEKLVQLYFAKDAVEKDFQTIKSEVELRPVRHRTDAKVRAHVTLCVLALLLHRWIEQSLKSAGIRMKASTALEEMEPVHLNHLRTEIAAVYAVTERAPEQEKLLSALGLTDAIQEGNLASLITERPAR